MAKKKSKGSGAGLWILGVIFCIAAAGAAYYYLGVLGKGMEPPRKPSSKPPIVTISEERKMTLYLPKETKDGFVLTPVSRKAPGKDGILDAAVNALLATTKDPGLTGNLIPEGTKLLTPVKTEGNVAVVNLSKEFVSNFCGGSDLEVLTLNAIVATVVANSEGKIQRVRFQVDGKGVESLGGHMDITEPMAPDPSVVKSEKGN